MKVRNRIKADKKQSKLGLSTEAPAGSIMGLHPVFSLTHVQPTFCLSKCTRDEKAAFADKMHTLCRLTWRDIINSDRHANGLEKLSATAFNYVPEQFRTETIVAFRFDGLKAMVGYKKHNVFYILWFDRNFTLYKHG